MDDETPTPSDPEPASDVSEPLPNEADPGLASWLERGARSDDEHR
jgi:hypothetical protein